MQKMLATLLVAGSVALTLVATAAAQNGETALVKIPFRFIVGEKMMPAGSYRVSAQTMDAGILTIASIDGGSVAAFASTGGAPNPAIHRRHPQLTFDNYYGQYFLRSVGLPGRDTREVKITKAQAERTLTRLNLMPAEFERTAR